MLTAPAFKGIRSFDELLSYEPVEQADECGAGVAAMPFKITITEDADIMSKVTKSSSCSLEEKSATS
jgi:hypothetical protein